MRRFFRIDPEKRFLKGQKRKLLKTKKRLERELRKITRTKQGTYKTLYLDFGSKEDDNAQEVQIYEGFMSIEKGLENLLEKVNKALTKIEKGKYGICEKCGKKIDKKRLEAFPEAELCAKCARGKG